MQLGEKQLLKVVKKVEFGVYLGEEDSEERVLLPIKQVPENIQVGDGLEVFLYKDSNNQRTSGNTGTDRKASGERSDQDRCISGLGIGKRSVSAV